MKNKPNSKKKLNGEVERGVDVNIKDNVEVHCLLFLRTRPRSVTHSERTRGIREWVQRVSPVVTTDVLHLGKYDSVTKTATFLGGYSQKGQSEQATGDVRAC